MGATGIIQSVKLQATGWTSEELRFDFSQRSSRFWGPPNMCRGLLSRGYSRRNVKLLTHLPLVLRPRMRWSVPPLLRTSSWRGDLLNKPRGNLTFALREGHIVRASLGFSWRSIVTWGLVWEETSVARLRHGKHTMVLFKICYNIKITVLWNVTPCALVAMFWHFGGIWR
jgi:hypothetical protein